MTLEQRIALLYDALTKESTKLTEMERDFAVFESVNGFPLRGIAATMDDVLGRLDELKIRLSRGVTQ